jgi:hypothetical protein
MKDGEVAGNIEVLLEEWINGFKDQGNRTDENFPCGGGLEYLHRGPASGKRRQKGNPAPGGISAPPVPGGYKHGDQALQVGRVSDEIIKYGREFCGTSTQE